MALLYATIPVMLLAVGVAVYPLLWAMRRESMRGADDVERIVNQLLEDSTSLR